MSHVNESCLTYEWVMSHTWMSQSCHMYGWVTLPVSQESAHGPQKIYTMNESCHAYEWVTSHIWMSLWMSHVTHMNASCHACVLHIHVWHDAFICVTWLIHMCDVTHSYVRHDSLIYITHTCDKTHSYEWHDSFIRETWLIHTWRDSFICATWLTNTWLIHTWDMTHSYMARHDSFIRETRLIHIWRDMTHSYVRHDSRDMTH